MPRRFEWKLTRGQRRFDDPACRLWQGLRICRLGRPRHLRNSLQSQHAARQRQRVRICGIDEPSPLRHQLVWVLADGIDVSFPQGTDVATRRLHADGTDTAVYRTCSENLSPWFLGPQRPAFTTAGKPFGSLRPDGTLGDIVTYSDTDGWTSEADGMGVHWNGKEAVGTMPTRSMGWARTPWADHRATTTARGPTDSCAFRSLQASLTHTLPEDSLDCLSQWWLRHQHGPGACVAETQLECIRGPCDGSTVLK